MALPPIYNPVVPCVHPIPGGMYPGRMIRVQGSVPPGAERFAINLQCGPNTDPRDDIALHLNFRFVEMCVVRNHLSTMSWGQEDTAGGMPIARGGPFEALVLCDPQSFKIALNGGHFCEFIHRVPFQRVSHITVDGDVAIQLIGFEGAQPQPQYMPDQQSYGAYGVPPPAYGAQGYGAPQGLTGPPPKNSEETSLSHDTSQENDDSCERISQQSSNITVDTHNLSFSHITIRSNTISNEEPIPVLPVQLSDAELVSNASDDFDEENKQFDEEEADDYSINDDNESIASNDSGNTFGDGPKLISNLTFDREYNGNLVNTSFSPINIVAQNLAHTVNNDQCNDDTGSSANNNQLSSETGNSKSAKASPEPSDTKRSSSGENSRKAFGIPTVYAKDVSSVNTEKDGKPKNRLTPNKKEVLTSNRKEVISSNQKEMSSRKESLPIRIGSTGKTKVTTKRTDSKISSVLSYSKNDVPKVLTIDMRSNSSVNDSKKGDKGKSDSPKKQTPDITQKTLDQVQNKALDEKLADIERSRNIPENAEFLRDKAQKIAVIRQVIVDQSEVLEELKKYTDSVPDEEILIKQGRALLTIQDSINNLFSSKAAAKNRPINLGNASSDNVFSFSPSRLVNAQDTTITIENTNNNVFRDEKLNIRLQSQLNNLHDLAEMEVMKFHAAKNLFNKNKLSDSIDDLDVKKDDDSKCELPKIDDDDDDDSDDKYGCKALKNDKEETDYVCTKGSSEKSDSDETSTSSKTDEGKTEADAKNDSETKKPGDQVENDSNPDKPANKVELNPNLKDIKGQLHDVSNVKPIKTIEDTKKSAKDQIISVNSTVDNSKSKNKSAIDPNSKDIKVQLHDVSNVKQMDRKTVDPSKKTEMKDEILVDSSKVDDKSKPGITEQTVESNPKLKDVKSPILHEISNVKKIIQKVDAASKKLDETSNKPATKIASKEVVQDKQEKVTIDKENEVKHTKVVETKDKKDKIIENSSKIDESKSEVGNKVEINDPKPCQPENKVEINSKFKDVKGQTLHDVSNVKQIDRKIDDTSEKTELKGNTFTEDSNFDNSKSEEDNDEETNDSETNDDDESETSNKPNTIESNKLTDKEQTTNDEGSKIKEVTSIEKYKDYTETVDKTTNKPKIIKTLQGFSVTVSTELIESNTVPINPASTIIVNNLYNSNAKGRDNESNIIPTRSIITSESTSKTYSSADKYETQNINIEVNRTNKSDKDSFNNNQINSESYTVSVLDNVGTGKYVVETENKGNTQILIQKQTYDILPSEQGKISRTGTDSTDKMSHDYVKKGEKQSFEPPVPNKVVNVYNASEDRGKLKETDKTQIKGKPNDVVNDKEAKIIDKIENHKTKESITENDSNPIDIDNAENDDDSQDTDINPESEQSEVEQKSSEEMEGETKIDLYVNEVEIIKDNQVVNESLKPTGQPHAKPLTIIENNPIEITIERKPPDPGEDIQSNKQKQEPIPSSNILIKDTESKIDKKDSTIRKLVKEVHTQPVENTVRILHSQPKVTQILKDQPKMTPVIDNKDISTNESETEINFSMDSQSLEERHDPTDIMKSITSSPKKENVTSDINQDDKIPAIVDIEDTAPIEVDHSKPMFYKIIHHPPHARVNLDGTITPIWQTSDHNSNEESFLIQVVIPDKTPSSSIVPKEEETDELDTIDDNKETVKDLQEDVNIEQSNVKIKQSNDKNKQENVKVEQSNIKIKQSNKNIKIKQTNDKIKQQNVNVKQNNEIKVTKENEKEGHQEINVVPIAPRNVANIIQPEVTNNTDDNQPQGYTDYGNAMPVQQQQRGGVGTGAAVGLGVGALAAGGLAGYALGGGFSDSRDEEPEVEGGDFGDSDWIE